jgi:hypothetical protein
MTYVPPPTPKQKAEMRRSTISALIWLAALPPLLFVLMVIGYSDLVPAPVRQLTIQIDAAFGSPVWSLIDPRKSK